jgi:hypothetical protein
MTTKSKKTRQVTPPMIADDPPALLLHAPMSDEACAHIWEFLSDLAFFFFESARFAQIRRSHCAQGDHRAKTPDSPLHDPDQLELFPDNPPS